MFCGESDAEGVSVDKCDAGCDIFGDGNDAGCYLFGESDAQGISGDESDAGCDVCGEDDAGFDVCGEGDAWGEFFERGTGGHSMMFHVCGASNVKSDECDAED